MDYLQLAVDVIDAEIDDNDRSDFSYSARWLKIRILSFAAIDMFAAICRAAHPSPDAPSTDKRYELRQMKDVKVGDVEKWFPRNRTITKIELVNEVYRVWYDNGHQMMSFHEIEPYEHLEILVIEAELLQPDAPPSEAAAPFQVGDRVQHHAGSIGTCVGYEDGWVKIKYDDGHRAETYRDYVSHYFDEDEETSEHLYDGRYCEAHGHDWKPSEDTPNVEYCKRCADIRLIQPEPTIDPNHWMCAKCGEVLDAYHDSTMSHVCKPAPQPPAPNGAATFMMMTTKEK